MSEPTRVLVVDDDPDIVETLRIVLERAKYMVASAESPQEAFEKLEAFKPNVILLDVMMPGGTEGFQFVWRLRNEYPPDVADTPVIILSAIHETTRLRFYPDKGDGTYKPGEFLPVQAFVDKPAEPQALLATIEGVLRG